jgi:hypothetical protein
MKKLLLALATAVTLVLLLLCPTPTGAQAIPPPAKRAARAQITEGPSLESFGDHNQAIIRWTSNNPGALWGRILRSRSRSLDSNGQGAHPAQSDPFLYGFSRPTLRPEAWDRVLL